MVYGSIAKELSLIANEMEGRKPFSLADAIEWVRVEMPSRIDHMLAIGYGIHYTDLCHQDKFLNLLDRNADYRAIALPIVDAAKKQISSIVGDALDKILAVDRDINQNIAIIFWAMYLSESNEQSAILRELERRAK